MHEQKSVKRKKIKKTTTHALISMTITTWAQSHVRHTKSKRWIYSLHKDEVWKFMESYNPADDQ